jgi:phospholipid/cholesterol/gamma-HCH transport system ATP-binding protein
LHAPESTVVDHVNWSAHAGELWVIAGLPASGKSDLLATAAGLMRPQRGTVRLFGTELGHLHEEERVAMQLRVGLVFGSGGRPFNQMTVAENLALPLCYHRNCVPSASEPRVQTVLQAMELTAVAHSTPAVLNRNLWQRLALARALVLSPELLFLDNPLASIDPRESRWWMKFLKSLRHGHPILDGRIPTLIVGTDDLRLWGEEVCQFAFLHDGQFTVVGSRTELVQQAIPGLRQLLPIDWLKA